MPNDDVINAVNGATSTLMTLYQNDRNQANFERQMQYQTDAMRSQMMYQDSQYARALHDNSIDVLAGKYARAGFDPREALNASPNNAPMSAPGGMSAPRSPSVDFSNLNAMFQRQHDARLDDVQRLLAGSKYLTDASLREKYQREGVKMLHDMVNDDKRMDLDTFESALKWYDITESLHLKRDELQQKSNQWNAEFEQRKHEFDVTSKETHRHNVETEKNPFQHFLENIDRGIDYAEKKLKELSDKFGFGVEDASSSSERASDKYVYKKFGKWKVGFRTSLGH